MVKLCRVIRIKLNQLVLRICPYYRYVVEKVTSTDVRITTILQSLPYKMAENSWYEEITSLSPYVYKSSTMNSDAMAKRRAKPLIRSELVDW